MEKEAEFQDKWIDAGWRRSDGTKVDQKGLASVFEKDV
jgi:hypothetical protein